MPATGHVQSGETMSPTPRTLILLFADQIFTFCLVAPPCIFCWVGCWQLFDIYVFPGNLPVSLWISFCIGNVGLPLMAFTQGLFKRPTRTKACSVRWFLGYHLYIYVCAIIGINHWRSTWRLLDFYTGITVESETATTVIGLCVLYLLRGTKNCLAPPLACTVDISDDVFEFETRFGIKPSSPEHYILDTLLTTFVIHNLVVFFWRGSWGLMDVLLYPDDPVASALTSLVTGAVLFVVLIAVQMILLKYQRIFHDRLGLRVFLDDVIHTVGAFCCVCEWRGIWNLSNHYIYPDNPEIGNWITHSVGTVATMLLLCCSSSMVKGFSQDGTTFETKQNFVFPNKYIRYFVERDRDGQETTEHVTPTSNGIHNESFVFSTQSVNTPAQVSTSGEVTEF